MGAGATPGPRRRVHREDHRLLVGELPRGDRAGARGADARVHGGRVVRAGGLRGVRPAGRRAARRGHRARGDAAGRRREAAVGDARRGRAGGRDRRAGRRPGHRRGVSCLGAGAAGRGRPATRAAARLPRVAARERRATLRRDHRDGGGRGPGTGRGDRGGARARRTARMSGRRSGVSERTYWGLFREREHSPGRESDDAEILRLTGKHLEGLGVQVELRAPEDLTAAETPPDGIFLMCERMEALRVLLAWQERGVRQVNAPLAVLNTYRERMIAQLREGNVPFIESRVVSTQDGEAGLRAPIWVKRPDVHNTQEGDVVFARTRDEAAAALAALAARGFERAVLQPPVEGDLIKFYGVGAGGGLDGGPGWFRWFYHRDQRVAGHPFDPARLARLVRAAATALGLEIYGGDAIASADGGLVLLDVNAWPSFALYRDEAAPVIADYLALRFAAPRGRDGAPR